MLTQQAVVCNSRGEPVRLTRKEQAIANMLQREFDQKFKNALGFDIPITTLTTIMKEISEQQFFHVAPADYFPVRVGNGAWSQVLTTYRSFMMGDQFETGIVNTGANNSRLATADAGVDSVNVNVINWAKAIGWTLIDLQLAAKSGNWDIVSAKEEARKTNWDLGIQRVAFLGARGLNGSGGACLGLLNQAGVTVNTTVITKAINTMTTTELKAFTAAVIQAYRANCNYTAWPTHFEIPESDYNGCAATVSPDFPIKSILQLLREMFQEIVPNGKFKAILPLSYADAANHADAATIANKQVYTLLNYDQKSIRMDVPVDYTNTLANSLDNFSFQNAAYGQFTGVVSYRPLEILYFQY